MVASKLAFSSMDNSEHMNHQVTSSTHSRVINGHNLTLENRNSRQSIHQKRSKKKLKTIQSMRDIRSIREKKEDVPQQMVKGTKSTSEM